MHAETIAAVSTPFGRGGIAVIRISGENAVAVSEKMFYPHSGKMLSSYPSAHAVYGRIVSEGAVIDDGIATIFHAPHSFTGENTVEISCHGGILLTERVLKTAFDCGAVPAQAGEFTERAFLNGKLDLSEAEAIIGLIDAESEEKLKLCASHVQGVLKNQTKLLCDRLTALLSEVYVTLDYPDEDLTELSPADFRRKLADVYQSLCETADTYREGKAVSEGVRTVLLGKPNTGKSSLLNGFLQQNRAIVSSLPGTTRDTLEETVSAGKILLRLCDTAGLRDSSDEIEKIGIQRALQKAEEADLIFAVFDRSRPLDEEDEALLHSLPAYRKAGKELIIVLTKQDLPAGLEERELADRLSALGLSDIPLYRLNTADEKGITELKKAAERAFSTGYRDYASVAVLANARQFSAVCGAKEAVSRALEALDTGFSNDICGFDIERAIASLGELDGRTAADSVVSQIFSRFCVGK